MFYNQTIATTTNYNALDEVVGYSVEVKTFEFFNILVLIFLFLIPFILIGWFRKLKRFF